jgi:small subunit ribosomal protein S16
MVKIRLQRLGRRNRPFYRLVAMDHRKRREGPVLENLGTYDPVGPKPEAQIVLNIERVKHWLSIGAQPSDTVRDMLAKRGLGDIATWEEDRKHDRRRLEERLAKKAAEGEKKEEKKG